MERILPKVNKVHLIGVGGAGMSGLAFLLQDKGFLVQGSDIKKTSKTAMLEKRGIKVYLGHKRANIDESIDLLCYSSAIGLDNSELKEAERRKIRIIKRGELLAYLCKNTKMIAVAGSHGKTTVVSLLSYLFKKAGYNPTVFIGGVPVDGSLPAFEGEGFSIVETDESDGTFLYYRPYFSLITNIDKEHLGYYKSFKNLKKSFQDFAEKTERKVFGNSDDNQVRKIVNKLGGVSFGLGNNCYLKAKNIDMHQKAGSAKDKDLKAFTYFDLYKEDKLLFKVKSPLLGKHNCYNLLAVFAVFDYLGEDLEKIKNYLVDFRGTKRRFQIKKEIFGLTFIDDYAHHPTEIRATLETARRLSGKRLFAIFQPHRPSRVKSLFDQFSLSFNQADLVVVTDIYRAGESYSEGINSLKLVKAIRNQGAKSVIYINKEELKSKIPEMIQKEDVVVCLGAGDINKRLEEIIDGFRENKNKEKC
ncbi:MAG: UDP-N-acetylmuramate--L-alanine ligase [Candidatus Omnitrophica bacterium]|nr:UDP-N-acetylmuramate--L-alanine ligase [Candidatus Omnitrophota bacterium]MCF7877030.1 UDP-N-acetylmuramate--L-alanine ligase [Candidatus Omnitrophota bacterium]MCF7892542.1 UDP-N-acetylmuramate--L-alanine ligase [Candidatus Omnitrophota bacterium]